MYDIEEIIRDIEKLSPISSISHRIIEISSDPDSSLTELVDVITYDQSMTANLLRVCNSSYFGLRRKIVSLKQAVAYLGIDKVASLVMMQQTAHNFRKAQRGYDLNAGELWRHSVSSALIAQDLAEKRDLNNTSLIFTSSLLKDIGKVILHHYVGDAFTDIMALVQNKGLAFNEAEKQIIGIDHAELGARVGKEWNFSPAMVNIIKNHHDPIKSPPSDLCIPIVYLADSICMMIGIGVGSDGLAYRHDQDVMARLKVSDIDVQETIADFWEKLSDVEELISLSGGN